MSRENESTNIKRHLLVFLKVCKAFGVFLRVFRAFGTPKLVGGCHSTTALIQRLADCQIYELQPIPLLAPRCFRDLDCGALGLGVAPGEEADGRDEHLRCGECAHASYDAPGSESVLICFFFFLSSDPKAIWGRKLLHSNLFASGAQGALLS